MAIKRFTVLKSITLGKTPYTVVDGKKNQFNSLSRGMVFEAEEESLKKLLAAKAISEMVKQKPAPVEEVAEEDKFAPRRGKR